MPPKPYPVRIRGVIYDSVKEAAAALGVSPWTVYQGIIRNCPDQIGLGRSASAGRKPISVTIAGHSFPSITAVAKLLGRPQSAVNRAIFFGGAKAKANLEAQVTAKAKERIMK